MSQPPETGPARRIYHLAPAADYAALAPGAPYTASSLHTEGFIHCTGEPDLLLVVANRLYRQHPGEFVVLEIDPARLTAPLRHEAPPPGDPMAGHLFPHLYGPLNRDAIVAVRPALRTAAGEFVSV